MLRSDLSLLFSSGSMRRDCGRVGPDHPHFETPHAFSKLCGCQLPSTLEFVLCVVGVVLPSSTGKMVAESLPLSCFRRRAITASSQGRMAAKPRCEHWHESTDQASLAQSTPAKNGAPPPDQQFPIAGDAVPLPRESHTGQCQQDDLCCRADPASGQQMAAEHGAVGVARRDV